MAVEKNLRGNDKLLSFFYFYIFKLSHRIGNIYRGKLHQ